MTCARRRRNDTWSRSYVGKTPAEVAVGADAVFTSLPGPVEVEAVALGDDGLCRAMRPGAVYFST